MTLLYTLMLIGFIGLVVSVIGFILTPKQWSTRVVSYTYGDKKTKYEVEQYNGWQWNTKGIFSNLEEATTKKQSIDLEESASEVVSKKVVST